MKTNFVAYIIDLTCLRPNMLSITFEDNPIQFSLTKS